MTNRTNRPRTGFWASPGDRLVIRGRTIGRSARDAEILESLGTDGSPPFRVRWQDTGRETEIFPGVDAYIEHFTKRSAGTTRRQVT